ncbi:phosphogluconate dehydrogenase (NAD(+)-dependent, decarboxylating) [Isachenkonia alkalipeptolytica]|uniref:Decarboxylating 6-phosphogluconate dehydrogenase n=1 Tax=Isachenkonia alkalipeptolytica TaxID=2565777 RepID=A0AA43XJL9_9CLOT|nr:decarboxylating 6-phosphogluconate dehydrogenase [Isachenkonia alkalipeptolytica]NBG87802.1 decarboxylating 6-phosphogluconate dehydrogenase [Isachenkonia alkalipeptolytica]
MEIGLLGLGKMGYALALNMHGKGHRVIGYNRSMDRVRSLENEGALGATSLENLVNQLSKPRVVWLMVPAGEAVEEVLRDLLPLLEKGDILIDGGNSNYKDTLRRAEELKSQGIHMMDIGTSGGIEGARHGACMMVGGNQEEYGKLESLLQDICLEDGLAHVGPVGAGHYVKMIHNGIEYGMMQAIGEGFEILKESPFDVDYGQIAQVWRHGSVIRGWLMDLTHKAFVEDPELSSIKGVVHASGEGLWSVQEALALSIPAPVMTAALFTRYRSQQQDTFSGKVVAGLRNQFGGHGTIKDES